MTKQRKKQEDTAKILMKNNCGLYQGSRGRVVKSVQSPGTFFLIMQKEFDVAYKRKRQMKFSEPRPKYL